MTFKNTWDQHGCQILTVGLPDFQISMYLPNYLDYKDKNCTVYKYSLRSANQQTSNYSGTDGLAI